ncbi:LPXTG cell wall anchor domain-containing protein [Listeria monocytogenes]|nr:LPXTG cell wall anchor domain-containing protein [Listeria monocytogenes]
MSQVLIQSFFYLISFKALQQQLLKPGEGPNVVSPTTPGSGGNQTPSNGSGLNLGNTTITSQGNISITSPATSQGGKLAKLGENSSLLLQGFGLLLALSGLIFFWTKKKKTHS